MRKWILATAFVSMLGGGFLGFILGHYAGYDRALEMWGGGFVERQLVEAGVSNTLFEAALESGCDRTADAARPFVGSGAMAVASLLPYLEGFQLERAQRYLEDALMLIERHDGPDGPETPQTDFVKRRLKASAE